MDLTATEVKERIAAQVGPRPDLSTLTDRMLKIYQSGQYGKKAFLEANKEQIALIEESVGKK